MSQINFSRTSQFLPPPDGKNGFGFDIYGNPCKIFADGTYEIIGNSLGLKNILANLGVGPESSLPTSFITGDTFVTNDTNKIYIALDDTQWLINDLVDGQLVTDISTTTYLLLQFFDNELVYLDEQSGFLVRIKVWNSTGVTIPKGKFVTPLSSFNGLPTIQYANARVKSKSKLIAGVYADIPPNSPGTVVKIGPITGLDVTGLISGMPLYLSSDGSGDPTSVHPNDGSYEIVIGAVGEEGVNGSIIVDIVVSQTTVETIDTNGFPPTQKTNTVLAKNDGNRTFSITPVVAPFHYYVEGEKFEKAAACSVTWSDNEGEHWFYFTGENLITIHNPTPEQIKDVILKYAFVATVYWNAEDQKTEFDIFDERHGINTPPSVHLYNHKYFGSRFDFGYALGDFVLGVGSSSTHAQYSIANGNYADEDIDHPGAYSPPSAEVPVAFLLGPSYFRTREQVSFSVLNAPANGRLYYNQFVGGNYFLTEAANDSYVLYFRFVVNGVTKRYLTAMGQYQYNTLLDAQNGLNSESASIKTGFTIKEVVLIGGVIYQTRNTDYQVSTTWTRSTTIITVTSPNHKLITGETINVTIISGGSQTTGMKVVTVIDATTFTYTGVNNGVSSGTVTYLALAFSNTTKSRIVPTSGGVSYQDYRTAALGKGIDPTSHAGLTDKFLAGPGITDGHIDDQAQTIAGPKSFTDTTTFNGDVVFNGNITQSVPGTIVFVNELEVADAIITTRVGATLPLGVGEYTGLRATKYDGTNDGDLVYDVNGYARVGDTGATVRLAAITDTPTANYFGKYNGTTQVFDTVTISTSDLTDTANIAKLNANNIFSGSNTFQNAITSTLTGSAPFVVASGALKVTNLDVDKVDGYDFDQALLTTSSPTFATVNFSNLTVGYIPYDTAGGLVNSGMYWDSVNSRLGIGTITPAEKLTLKTGKLLFTEVDDNITAKYNSQGVLWSTLPNLPSIAFNAASGSRPELSWYRGSRTYPEFSIRQNTTSDTGGTIFSGTGLVAPIETMTFNNGSVGIGTTTPSYLLDINNTARIQNNLIVNSVLASHSAGLQLHNDNVLKWSLRLTAADDDFGIYDGTAYRFYIDRTTSNVGIGTSDPQEKVQVSAGNIRVDQQATPALLRLNRINTTIASPTAVVDTNVLSQINFGGQYSTGSGIQTTIGAIIRATATGNWSATNAMPTKLEFLTSPAIGPSAVALTLNSDLSAEFASLVKTKGVTIVKDTATAMTTTINFQSTSNHTKTMTANETWAFSNIVPGSGIAVSLIMGATLRTITCTQSGVTFKGKAVAGVIQGLAINKTYLIGFLAITATEIWVSVLETS